MLVINIAGGMTVYPKIIEKHLNEELPFMATENILMHCVKKGGDRQELHEKIRLLSVEAGKKIKLEGAENNLLDCIAKDESFGVSREELNKLLDAKKFTGRAEQQTEEFLIEIRKLLDANKEFLDADAKIFV